jgi:hypothetical protein
MPGNPIRRDPSFGNGYWNDLSEAQRLTRTRLSARRTSASRTLSQIGASEPKVPVQPHSSSADKGVHAAADADAEVDSVRESALPFSQ